MSEKSSFYDMFKKVFCSCWKFYEICKYVNSFCLRHLESLVLKVVR